MRRDDLIDFFEVPASQLEMDARLHNWSRVVRVWVATGKPLAMWANYRSKVRQWHPPEPVEVLDSLDATRIEVAVRHLPELHRSAIRWHYVNRCGPLHMARMLGLSKASLHMYVLDGRQMLINRRV